MIFEIFILTGIVSLIIQLAYAINLLKKIAQ